MKAALGRTAWAGNLHDVRVALASGHLSPRDLGALRLPTYEAYPGWAPMFGEDDHAKVGEKAADLAEMMRQRGMPDTANELTVESWIEHATSEGWCVANRADALHGRVWCDREEAPDHGGLHNPACPTCHNVKLFMLITARQAGEWG